MMLQRLTVQYLFHRTTPSPARSCFRPAGGVGTIACQRARSEGITLTGTAGSDEKCMAIGNGAAHAINYRTEDFVARVREIAEGRGVDVVVDGVGKDTF